MLSLSDNEFSVISFLVRNFTEKLTIRNIAHRLSFSPAGVFNILKKLDKENIVVGEKLGTGLFYSINFENKIAEHLAAIVLLYSKEKAEFDIGKIIQAKAAILHEKNLLLIADNVSVLDVSIPNLSIVVKNEDEFVDLLRKKDQQTLKFLKEGIVLLGEEKIVQMIKHLVSRF